VLLRFAHDVIVDSTYGRPEQRRSAENVARKTRAAMLLVQCQVSPKIAQKRFKDRPVGHAAIDLTQERVALLAESYPYCAEGLILNTGTTISACLAKSEKYLSGGTPARLGEWVKCARNWPYWPGPQGCAELKYNQAASIRRRVRGIQPG